MSNIYFLLGLEHIANIKAYDHIIFLLTLMAVYVPKEWKQIVVLITAFTIGHSATLILATLQVININAYLIELLIPITILITGIINIVTISYNKNQILRYNMALFFGLIHGLGFSNTIKALLMGESNIVMPLFGFNVGVEAGQLVVVCIIFLVTHISLKYSDINFNNWKYLLSGAGIGTSLVMIVDRI